MQKSIKSGISVYFLASVSLLASFFPFLMALDFLRSSLQLMNDPYPLFMAFFFFPAALTEVFFCFLIFRFYHSAMLRRNLWCWFLIVTGAQFLISAFILFARSLLLSKHLGVDDQELQYLFGSFIQKLPVLLFLAGFLLLLPGIFLYIDNKKKIKGL